MASPGNRHCANCIGALSFSQQCRSTDSRPNTKRWHLSSSTTELYRYISVLRTEATSLKCVATFSRLLRNRVYQEPVPIPELGHPLRVTVDPRKEHPSSIEKSIRMHVKYSIYPHPTTAVLQVNHAGLDGPSWFSSSTEEGLGSLSGIMWFLLHNQQQKTLKHETPNPTRLRGGT